MRRVLIAHGWADDPARGWIGWLVRELKQRSIEASAPAFPNPKTPDVREWLKVWTNDVGRLTRDDILVGHSLGCPLILRHLSDYTDDVQIAGIVLVAGMADNSHRHLSPLYDPPIDFEKVKRMVRRRACIYSDDDTSVIPERSRELARMIDAEEIVDPGKGHFSGPRGLTELPSVLQAVLKCFDKPDSLQ